MKALNISHYGLHRKTNTVTNYHQYISNKNKCQGSGLLFFCCFVLVEFVSVPDLVLWRSRFSPVFFTVGRVRTLPRPLVRNVLWDQELEEEEKEKRYIQVWKAAISEQDSRVTQHHYQGVAQDSIRGLVGNHYRVCVDSVIVSYL